MEQYVTKKNEGPSDKRNNRGLLYWIFWLVLSFLALAYTLPFLLIGGLCGLMLFARNRMDGAFAWRNKVVRRFTRQQDEDDGGSSGDSGTSAGHSQDN